MYAAGPRAKNVMHRRSPLRKLDPPASCGTCSSNREGRITTKVCGRCAAGDEQGLWAGRLEAREEIRHPLRRSVRGMRRKAQKSGRAFIRKMKQLFFWLFRASYAWYANAIWLTLRKQSKKQPHLFVQNGYWRPLKAARTSIRSMHESIGDVLGACLLPVEQRNHRIIFASSKKGGGMK